MAFPSQKRNHIFPLAVHKEDPGRSNHSVSSTTSLGPVSSRQTFSQCSLQLPAMRTQGNSPKIIVNSNSHHLLCARHWIPTNKLRRWALLLSPIYKWGNWESGKITCLRTHRQEVVGLDLSTGLSITRTRFITTVLSCLQKGCSAVLQIPRSLINCLKLRITWDSRRQAG